MTTQFYETQNVGHARYTVSFTDGIKTHADGSPFYDIRIFSNKRDLAKFIRELTAESKAKPAAEPVDTASMSDAELFAPPYYKRTGLREDVRFFLATARDISAETRAQGAVLLAELESRKSTTADRKQYNRLTDAWRHASLHDELVEQPKRIRQARIARRLARANARMAA